MDLLKIASVPGAIVDPATTVLDSVKLMADHRVGAVAVTDGETLAGIFTERDLMIRVVLEGKDPGSTPVSDVMTADCVSASKDMAMGEALLQTSLVGVTSGGVIQAGRGRRAMMATFLSRLVSLRRQW